VSLAFHGQTLLAPLTRGGNLPFRRLCVDLGAVITISEMAYARQILRRSKAELALLRHHESETCFGVQLATAKPDEAVRAGHAAVDRGAAFVDLNVGCPIHDVVRRGMGATLLRRPAALARVVEAMVRELPVPVTVKIRSGWSEDRPVALALGRAIEDAGAAAVALHPRSRVQRYSRAADWQLVAALVEALSIPVIGNGDILTHYEARQRRRESGCAALMIGRGALIKPWLFREIAEGREWQPTAEERVELYWRLAGYQKDHFRDDDRGRERAMRFLPWHLDFLSRYRPLPEEKWGESSREHPLIQTRVADEDDITILEAVLRDPRAEMHERIAGVLWDSASVDAAVAGLMEVAAAFPPVVGEAVAIRTSHG